MRCVVKADLLCARMVPTLANFADEFVFVSGGQDPAYQNVLDTVNRYDVANDKWSQSPAMTKPRVGHASCSLDDKLYVFCGGVVIESNLSSSENQEICEPNPDNSIEYLDVRALINNKTVVKW